MTWNAERWPNFSENELACPHCGVFVVNEHALDCLQKLRNLMGAPLLINSATRCAVNNELVGGTPGSEHLNGRAFDIHIGPLDRAALYANAKIAGFTGFGFGRTFLHVDIGRERHWDYGPASGEDWFGIRP